MNCNLQPTSLSPKEKPERAQILSDLIQTTVANGAIEEPHSLTLLRANFKYENECLEVFTQKHSERECQLSF